MRLNQLVYTVWYFFELKLFCTFIQQRVEVGHRNKQTLSLLLEASFAGLVMSPLSKVVDSATLNRLKSIDPPVHSVEDLLTRCNIALSNELKCDIQEVMQIKLHVAGSMLRSTSTGTPSKSWMDFPSSIPDVAGGLYIPRSTGFKSLDDAFEGGFAPSRMIEVLGNSGSGKTQMCLSTALACARSGLKVFILSTNNDISIYRIRRMLDFAMAQDAHLSDQQKQDVKLYTLSNLFIQPVFDVWAAMDTLCRVRAMRIYDVLVVDSAHSLFAPYLTAASTGGLHSSSSVSAVCQTVHPGQTGGSSAPGAPVSVTGPCAVSFQPIISDFYLLLRSLVASGLTVLVTNVLERDSSGLGGGGGRARSFTAGVSGAAGFGAHNAPVQHQPQWTPLKLPSGTGGRGCSADIFDAVLVLAPSSEQARSDVESVFTATIALRPPQFTSRPSVCELRVPKI